MLSKYFNNPEANFQPDGKALKVWLSTNKTTMTNAGIVRPGMFNEPSITSSLGFLLVLFIELLATVWVNQEGMAITNIVAAILVDIGLAIASHHQEGRIIQAKNELLFNTKALRSENVKKVIRQLTLLKNVFYFLILASGAYKGISFYFLYATFDSTTLCIIIAYLAAAILHIYCTGYAFAYWRFSLIMSNQFSKFMDTEGEMYAYDKEKPRQTAIEINTTLTEVRTNKHAIVLKQGVYYFETKGILLDTDLSDLISGQKTQEQQRVVAIEGVRLQCSQLTWGRGI